MILFYPEELDNQLAALEAAVNLYPGDFGAGCAFALGLVRLALGLSTQLTIPMRREVILDERPTEYK